MTGEITVLDPTAGEVVDTFTAPEIEEALAAIQDEDKGYATSDLWVLYSTDGENWSVDAASEIGIDDFSNGVDGVFTTDSTIALRVLGALPAGSGDEITDTVVVGTTGG